MGSAPGGRGKGSGAEGFTYQESWLAIDESFSSSFDCQTFRDIGSDMFLKMGILSSFSTMRGRLFGGPLKRLYSLRSLLSDVHDQYGGLRRRGVSYHRPPAIKTTKAMPAIAATTSIAGE